MNDPPMAAAPRRRPPSATLFAQIMALVMLSLGIAQAINVWVIFHLPRPSPEFYTATEISQALLAGPSDSHSPRDAHPLLVHRLQTPPSKVNDGRYFRRLRQEIGATLEIPTDNVIVTGTNPADGRSIREVRDQLQRAGQPREAPFLIAPFRVLVTTKDGQWLGVDPPSPRLTLWQMRIIVWFLIAAFAMAPVAWLFSRRLSTSVALFAEAAERLGRDPLAPPLQAKGPSEIAPAITAFNEMQDRLRRYVVDRTAMAAAMAHDLRTPLTRLRFRVESAPPEVQAKMITDIEEMEAMISASLAYVRDSRGQTEHTPLELSSLLESVVDDMAETGKAVTVERSDRVVLRGDPMGLRRLLTNLIENACKFGGAARSRVFIQDGCAVIQIEDDGPGVPTGDLEKVFEPFYRGEPSRSRETGGSGLGLAAVRSIARGHGGDVTLRNREIAGSGPPTGVFRGLVAEVKLPL